MSGQKIAPGQVVDEPLAAPPRIHVIIQGEPLKHLGAMTTRSAVRLSLSIHLLELRIGNLTAEGLGET